MAAIVLAAAAGSAASSLGAGTFLAALAAGAGGYSDCHYVIIGAFNRLRPDPKKGKIAVTQNTNTHLSVLAIVSP